MTGAVHTVTVDVHLAAKECLDATTGLEYVGSIVGMKPECDDVPNSQWTNCILVSVSSYSLVFG